MTTENFNPTKDDKWLLASHLQKSIRRGLDEEAAWAAGHLHAVDRSYLSYRLSVIAVEDTAAGDLETTASLVGDVPWGAKRFGTSRDEAEREMWQDAARTLAKQRKDRTPCDWMACRHWLEEFQQQEGPWENLDPVDSIDHAENTSLPWWKRGLFAWRAAGTDRFPTDSLPAVMGAWEDWVAATPNKDLQTVMVGLGARQREPHPVFLPLAVRDRMEDKSARMVDYKVENFKHGPWLSSAIDGHTQPGLAALHQFVRSLPDDVLREVASYKASPVNIAKRMMFWMDGGHINKGWEYSTQRQISMDTRRKWLQDIRGGDGSAIVKHLSSPDQWRKYRQLVIEGMMTKSHVNPRLSKP